MNPVILPKPELLRFMMSARYQNGVFLLTVCLLCCAAAMSDDFTKVAVIKDNDIDESSGLAISYRHDDALWTHNDSGDKPRLYLIGLDGRTKGRVTVDDVKAHDWEDMCSFQIDGTSWLLAGDVGDNDKQRGKKNPDCRLLLLKEPVLPINDGDTTIKRDVSVAIKFTYEDGPRDCEGVAVDVERREILLISKSAPHKCGLYVMPLDLKDAKQKRKAKRIAAPFVPFATSLDISPSGRTMVVGSMGNGVVVERQAGQSWTEAFARGGTPLSLPVRRQGETICFDRTGRSLYLTSEHADQPLWRISLTRSQ